jgi:hypothetical protein
MEMTVPTLNTDRKVYVPPAYGKRPKNPTQALEAAAALLEEEGRWRQGEWYSHDNPTMKEYADDPYCNGWGACADGALRIVTTGLLRDHDVNLDLDVETCWTMFEREYLYPEDRGNKTDPLVIYSAARDRVQHILLVEYGYRSNLEEWNDEKATREMVIDLFHLAAKSRGSRPRRRFSRNEGSWMLIEEDGWPG